MESFQWNQYFETGLREVDLQHHHLVNLINEFGHHLAENTLVPQKIDRLCSELANYAEYHFAEEEQLMQRRGIDSRHLEGHIEEHHGFLNEVVQMHAALTPNDRKAARYLMDFLTHWLAYHILGSDQNMARQIKAIEQGMDARTAYEQGERFLDNATEALLNALNNLFQQVSERNRQLVKLNQILEEKVRERTQELSEANRHLEILAQTDALTGLPNRRHALQRLQSLWDEAARHDTPLVCMMVDADHFKEVNDTHGHDAGDDVLRILAHTLRDNVRSDDVVCRLGGDEFFIICPDTDLRNGLRVAETMREKVAALEIPVGDGFWYGSVSVGVAARTESMDHADQLIRNADQGVYVAKRDGKNCVRTLQAISSSRPCSLSGPNRRKNSTYPSGSKAV